jgi:hypothetical protein
MADTAVLDLPVFDGKDLWLALPAQLSLDGKRQGNGAGRLGP